MTLLSANEYAALHAAATNLREIARTTDAGSVKTLLTSYSGHLEGLVKTAQGASAPSVDHGLRAPVSLARRGVQRVLPQALRL